MSERAMNSAAIEARLENAGRRPAPGRGSETDRRPTGELHADAAGEILPFAT